MRGPVEFGQYTAADYTQELDDHGVLASVGSVGDAYDNAMAESFVDSFKTELIADRSWRSPPGPVPPPATLCRPSISASSAIP